MIKVFLSFTICEMIAKLLNVLGIKRKGDLDMDIIILFIMSYLFYILAFKHDTSKKVLIIFAAVLVLDIILFKLQATSTLPISL